MDKSRKLPFDKLLIVLAPPKHKKLDYYPTRHELKISMKIWNAQDADFCDLLLYVALDP